ncbi:MAG: hypothetical protein E4H36_02615 [Spirochaetales bacterium]|nr:MAG: hypothetical protein E4H36_02615 [Spirochaetales bacterium]
MIVEKNISLSQIEEAMKAEEFGTDIIQSGSNVAVIMSQSWCPQWHMVKSFLSRLNREGRPEEIDIDVYEIVYDQLEIFHQFLRFKEETFGNDLIPYIRYYKNGSFMTSTNYVSESFFVRQFE